MTSLLLLPSEEARQWLDVLLGATVRGSLLIVGAMLCTSAVRRRGAAVRSFIWNAALCAVLIVPVLSAILPRWRAEVGLVVTERARTAASELARTIRPDPVRDARYARNDDVGESAVVEGAPVESPAGARTAAGVAHGWAQLLLLVWLLGVAAGLLRLLGSWLRLRTLIRGARPATDQQLAHLVAAYARSMGLVRQVRVLEGSSRAIPLICGVLRPRLLLPAGWQRWPDSVLSAVLQHELAHVRRWDLLAQLLCDAARVLHWFNPLVWLAAREARVAGEQACDDEVLTRGVAPAVYAEALLVLVRMLRQPTSTRLPALGIAAHGELVRRIEALMDVSRARRPVSGTMALALGFGVCLAAAALASISPAEARAAESADGRVPITPCCGVAEPVVIGPLGHALDRAFSRMADSGFAGTVLVEHNERVVFAKGFGLADREKGTPNTVTTRYHVAGITKVLTAAAVAELIDRGLVDVDAPVSRYLPELRGRAGTITVHQLLTHTDGLSDVHLRAEPSNQAEFLGAVNASTPVFAAGRSYGPGNAGHSVLALLVERLTGEPFERRVRRRFLEPAGMTHSFLRTEPAAPLDSVALGYADVDDRTPVEPRPDVWGVRGSRGLVSTVGDLHRWYSAFRGGSLVSAAAMEMMLTPRVRTAKAFDQGYGWLLYDETSMEPFRSDPPALVRRSGREAGFEAEMVHDRSGDWVAIVLVNSDMLLRLRAIETIRAAMQAQPPPRAAGP